LILLERDVGIYVSMFVGEGTQFNRYWLHNREILM